jgi:hypothetical protein
MSCIDRLFCRPGISKINKSRIGLIAVKDISSNTKVLNRPCYHGQWVFTKELQCDIRVILELQDLYRNKKLFMQDSNKIYTFIPDIPIYDFHGEMFLNHASASIGNVILKNNGYYTCKNIEAGDELLIIV